MAVFLVFRLYGLILPDAAGKSNCGSSAALYGKNGGNDAKSAK
jgi:hypothetical protein